jgi:hypothetical protein
MTLGQEQETNLPAVARFRQRIAQRAPGGGATGPRPPA